MTEEKITGAIGTMYSDKVVELWNECIRDKNYPDDEVFYNDEEFFNEMFGNAYGAVLSVTLGDWRNSDDYVAFDGYGNVVSFNYWNDYNSPIDVDILAEWLSENPAKLEELGIEDEEDEEEED